MGMVRFLQVSTLGLLGMGMVGVLQLSNLGRSRTTRSWLQQPGGLCLDGICIPELERLIAEGSDSDEQLLYGNAAGDNCSTTLEQAGIAGGGGGGGLLPVEYPQSTAAHYLSSAISWSEVSVLLLLAALPSVCFWATSTALHLLGANEGYKGKVTFRSMVVAQLCIDLLQTASALPRFFAEPHSRHLSLRPPYLVLGVVAIDIVEYGCHRLMHANKFLRRLHKRHHQLIPLHTFGAYYNSAGEALFTGSFLGMGMVGVLQLSILEMAIVASFATVCTVFDHCPSSFWGGATSGAPSHHEIHHNVCSDCNFAQPFTPFLDYVFGTRYEDVLRRRKEEEGGGGGGGEGGARSKEEEEEEEEGSEEEEDSEEVEEMERRKGAVLASVVS